jgi:tetratricopeptide (TPR) repeat protein
VSIHPGGRNSDANRERPIRATAARPTRYSTRQKQKAKPIDLSITAVGRQHHPIHTRNKEAQEFFNQGITLIYAFNHEEAARSFRRAAELDATSPMPLWGIALAVGPNYNSNVDAEGEKLAFETIQKAQQLATAAPQVEKDYVATLATRYSGDASPDYKQLSQNYAAAMKALSAKYPDDLDAATMYAESLMDLNPWKLWSADGKPAENTVEIVTVLESVLARNPGRAGANHYYIHAVEASSNPARALPSAHRLDTMVPQAGHLVHMPTHIYERTGDFDLAARNNAEAVKGRHVVRGKSRAGWKHVRPDVSQPQRALRSDGSNHGGKLRTSEESDGQTKAVAIQEPLNYDEPADWSYPVRESLGAALLAAGNAPEAERVFRLDLQQNPRNPRSLYGLMQALEAQGNGSDAAWVEAQFNAAWKNADSKLSLKAL